MPIPASVGTAEAELEIEQDAQPLDYAMHRRLSHLASARAEALLRDSSDLVTEHIACAAQSTFWGAHFHVKGNPAFCPRKWKHHHEARGAPVEAIGRNHHRGADEILLMPPRRAEIDRPDFAA